MNGQTNNDSPRAKTKTDRTSPGDSTAELDAINAPNSESELLVTTLRGNVTAAAALIEKIEHDLASVQQTRADAEAQLAPMRDAATSIQQQVEAAKATINEINTLLATTQSTRNQVTDTKAEAGATMESIRAALTTASDAATRAEAMRTQVEQAAAVVATKSEHIEAGRVHVDEVRSKLDTALTEAQQSATSTEAQHQAGRATMDNLNNLYAAAQTIKANADSDAQMVASLRQQCEQHAATAKSLADIAETTDARVKAYEMRLADLEKLATERLKTIESLLPGATSAGLAFAFEQRRKHFKWPQRIWQGVFIACVLALLALAAWEFGVVTKADALLTYQKLGLSLLHRLPFALPLIWLAFHSSHKAALAQRVEEDYGFKETVSRSFEGYRHEMAELEGKATPDSPVTQLCARTLGVITRRPGMIYEKHPLNMTPLDALTESAVPIVELAKKMKLP